MENISIIKKNSDNDKKIIFEVVIGEGVDKTEYKVTLSESYWRKLTNEEIDSRKLIRKSFEFLLSKEPKEAILPEFDLSIIGEYFPDYEDIVKNNK